MKCDWLQRKIINPIYNLYNKSSNKKLMMEIKGNMSNNLPTSLLAITGEIYDPNK